MDMGGEAHVKTDNFALIAQGIDVSPLRHSMSMRPELWGEITLRQKFEGTPHSETECIFLRWAKEKTLEAAFIDIEAADTETMEKLPGARELIEKVCNLIGCEKLGRSIMTRLAPNGLIDKHSDEGAYADYYERFHLCIEGDQSNIFYVESSEGIGEYATFKPGEIWWFNHKRPHWAFNGSEKPRIHLIIDAVCEEYKRPREDWTRSAKGYSYAV